MSKKIISRNLVLIGFSLMYIFSSSVSVFAGNINDSIDNVNQGIQVIDEIYYSEKQQLFEIVADPTLTDEEKAEVADKLLYEGKNNIEDIEDFPSEKVQFGGVNTGVIDSPLAPESERVKDIILAPNFTNEQKIDALNRLLYIGKEAEAAAKAGNSEIAAPASLQDKSLDIKIYKQKESYYCVPACVFSTIKYLTGSSYSQSFIASALGTTKNGTPFGNALPYLNIYQNNYEYTITKTKSLIAAKANWFNTIYNYNVPVLFSAALRKSDNWKYDSNGHCMMLIGVSSDNRQYRIGDPYIKWVYPDRPSNKYKRYAKRIHNAILLHNGQYIY